MLLLMVPRSELWGVKIRAFPMAGNTASWVVWQSQRSLPSKAHCKAYLLRLLPPGALWEAKLLSCLCCSPWVVCFISDVFKLMPLPRGDVSQAAFKNQKINKNTILNKQWAFVLISFHSLMETDKQTEFHSALMPQCQLIGDLTSNTTDVTKSIAFSPLLISLNTFLWLSWPCHAATFYQRYSAPIKMAWSTVVSQRHKFSQESQSNHSESDLAPYISKKHCFWFIK